VQKRPENVREQMDLFVELQHLYNTMSTISTGVIVCYFPYTGNIKIHKTDKLLDFVEGILK
jgi:hypothetical protein